MKKVRTFLLTIIAMVGFSIAVTSATMTHADAAVMASKTNRVVSMSRQFIGTRYIWGGTTPRGFDCSGYVQFLYRRAGINLPRTSQQQARVVKRINVRDARPGDLVFWQSRSNVYHVGISLGNGNFISALRPGMGVQINRMSRPTFAGRL